MNDRHLPLVCRSNYCWDVASYVRRVLPQHCRLVVMRARVHFVGGDTFSRTDFILMNSFGCLLVLLALQHHQPQQGCKSDTLLNVQGLSLAKTMSAASNTAAGCRRRQGTGVNLLPHNFMRLVCVTTRLSGDGQIVVTMHIEPFCAS